MGIERSVSGHKRCSGKRGGQESLIRLWSALNSFHLMNQDERKTISVYQRSTAHQ